MPFFFRPDGVEGEWQRVGRVSEEPGRRAGFGTPLGNTVRLMAAGPQGEELEALWKPKGLQAVSVIAG